MKKRHIKDKKNSFLNLILKSNLAIIKFIFLTLVLLAIFVFADGWDPSKPFHLTLYTDNITSKTDASLVTISDSLSVSGNVGIGTTAPSAKLAVGGTGRSGDTIAAYANSANSALYAEQANALGYAGYFNGRTAFNGITTFMNGRVGIGTLNPARQFHIYDTTGSSNFYVGGDPGGYPRVFLGGSSGSFAGVINRINPGATLYFGEGGDSGGYQFRGSGNIYLQGNVGIGTTDPGTYKLKVAGQISASNYPPGSCVVGSSIRAINADGTVVCENDDTGGGTLSCYTYTHGPPDLTTCDESCGRTGSACTSAIWGPTGGVFRCNVVGQYQECRCCKVQ